MLSSRWQNHKRRSSALILCVFVFVIESSRASLSELHTKIQKNSHPPPNEDGPSKVKIGVYIESLAEMSFDADLYLYMLVKSRFVKMSWFRSWKDSSLNHTEPEYILNAYIASKVNITWFTNEPIRFNHKIGLPEFLIEKIHPSYCDGTYRFEAIPYYYRRAVPARVTLSFTTLLSLSTLGNGLRMGLPQVSYAKALDLWFGVCMFFVFLNLLEFAFVNSYMRQAEKYEKMARTVSKRGEKNAPVDSRLPTEDEEPALSKDSIFLYSQNGNPIRRAAASTSTSNDIELRDTGISSRRTPKSDSVFMPLDESPTKTTFVSEDEWDVPFGSRRPIGKKNLKMYSRNRRRPQQRRSFPSGRNPMANNEFIRTGFDYSRKGLRVDKWSRVLFPAGFFVFNVLYWGYYLWFLRRNSNYDDFDGPGE
ncbi:hypothetical protein M3Y98_00804500 [Aphelenchoides besseyi]|nr:hypothetical protein M3Y98_00804500 [Aphelenchoides besseyi]